MLKVIFILVISSLIILLQPLYLLGDTVGCTLNDPDKDIKLVFPQSTDYKTKVVTIKESGGEKLAKKIEERLGGKLDPVVDALDVPHAFYTVLKGEETVGYIHGVDQKGAHGDMQIFLALDPDGKIVKFFYQKISSPEAEKFKGKAFAEQFKGVTLADFYHHDAMGGRACHGDRIAEIKDPSENSRKDFLATLRGIKMNLILYDKFIFNNKYEKSHDNMKGM